MYSKKWLKQKSTLSNPIWHKIDPGFEGRAPTIELVQVAIITNGVLPPMHNGGNWGVT